MIQISKSRKRLNIKKIKKPLIHNMMKVPRQDTKLNEASPSIFSKISVNKNQKKNNFLRGRSPNPLYESKIPSKMVNIKLKVNSVHPNNKRSHKSVYPRQFISPLSVTQTFFKSFNSGFEYSDQRSPNFKIYSPQSQCRSRMLTKIIKE